MTDPRQDAVRGALTYLGDAERRISSVEGDNLGWAVVEQFAPNDTRRPEGAPGLYAPVWLWAVPPAIALALLGSLVGVWLLGALIGAAVGVAGRVYYTVSVAHLLRRPGEEAMTEIHRALGEAARFMHEAGVEWVGADPSVVGHPGQMLAPVRATRARLQAELHADQQS
jgi:hypothetical protein